jgi:multidrug efflux pump subunit AcrA (membrane-fusion protein)
VPLESVVSFAGVTRVFVVQSNLAHNRTVKTGRIRDGLQEIVDGLKPGEVVVVTGQNRLTDGAPVSVQAGDPGGVKPAFARTGTDASSTHDGP